MRTRLRELVAFQRFARPFNGVIANRQFDRGDFIPGDSAANGRWLFHVMRVNELRVLLDVPPATALALKAGGPATVEFSEMPGEEYVATVAREAGLIDAASGTMRIELTLPNEDRAIPAGLNGVAFITPEAGAKRLLVPVNALVTRAGRQNIALVRDGKVAFVPVQTGRNLGTKVEILTGLRAGLGGDLESQRPARRRPSGAGEEVVCVSRGGAGGCRRRWRRRRRR